MRSGFRPDKTCHASLLNNVKNIPQKACLSRIHTQKKKHSTKNERQRGPVVWALGLLTVAPGSNPILTSGLNLFLVVPDSTLPCIAVTNWLPSAFFERRRKNKWGLISILYITIFNEECLF